MAEKFMRSKRLPFVVLTACLAVLGFLTFGPGGVASAHSATGTEDCDGVHVHANANYEGDANNNKLTITVGGVSESWFFGSGGIDKTVPVPQGGATTAWSWSIDANINTGNDKTGYDEYHEGNVGPCGEPEPVVVTPTVLYTPPTCDSVGTLEFPESENYTVIDNEDGTYTFVANKGSVFPEDTETIVGPFELAQLIGEGCEETTTSSSSTTTTTTSTTTTTTTIPGQTTTTTAPPAQEFRFGAATTVCVAEVPTIRITFANTFPELAGRTGTLTMTALNGGAVLSTQSLVYQPGTTVDLLYPGTRVNPDGSIADVPGWNLNSLGLWVRDPSDAFLRDGIALSYTVNPTATALVTYPPESANCANPENPPPAPVPPAPQLPSTL